MRKLIDTNYNHDVVCDNPNCDYTVPYGPDELIHYIGKPCPLCGENLLTVEDYLVHERMMKGVRFINKWFSWLTIFYSKNAKQQYVKVHYHNGDVSISKVTEK